MNRADSSGAVAKAPARAPGQLASNGISNGVKAVPRNAVAHGSASNSGAGGSGGDDSSTAHADGESIHGAAAALLGLSQVGP